jgi:hypothetical protein
LTRQRKSKVVFLSQQIQSSLAENLFDGRLFPASMVLDQASRKVVRSDDGVIVDRYVSAIFSDFGLRVSLCLIDPPVQFRQSHAVGRFACPAVGVGRDACRVIMNPTSRLDLVSILSAWTRSSHILDRSSVFD